MLAAKFPNQQNRESYFGGTGNFDAGTGILFAKNGNRRRMRFSVHTGQPGEFTEIRVTLPRVAAFGHFLEG